MRLLCILYGLFSCFITIQASLVVIATNDTFSDRPAAFGPKLTRHGTLGYLIEPLDPTGCQWVEAPMENWIALVKRGGCSFVTKVRTMQESGAIGVVIGDNVDQQQWITILFLAQHEYKAILALSNLVDTPMMIMMKLDDALFLTAWPFLDMLMIIFVSPSIMMLFIYVSYKIRQRQKKLQDIAPKTLVSKLTFIKLYHQEKRLENDADTCAICLEEYRHGEQLRVLPCHHDFHPMCVDAWLTTQKKYCPLCKISIQQQQQSQYQQPDHSAYFMHKNNEITPLIHPIVV
ncbi:hypothetical protein BJ944DRAFT_202113 [Cunninghamella echinulata]|nr:hypothetical protein BJ944DRAFT_202113 [Cunninghamella echinulata]